MGLFDRFTRARARTVSAEVSDARHLADWARSRYGVEAFIEPETTVTELTVVLVAANGEWTRRKVGGERGARRLGQELHIPVYDVRKTGYPQRMRDYDARQRIERKRARAREFE
ncbi:oxidoreductase [Rhodococcus xishaensis]|uniref:Oxidoreductase n=1 Tax=Rhodococcus xishaensis TaxID=2487364 RepID=A0A438B3P4_9NOCA|nr:oxidoreductase [Rhodococcus xishaensis]RVW05597.1 oxidoreductase [Rhodococcus xishaensis]